MCYTLLSVRPNDKEAFKAYAQARGATMTEVFAEIVSCLDIDEVEAPASCHKSANAALVAFVLRAIQIDPSLTEAGIKLLQS